jgi:hypothetical protein
MIFPAVKQGLMMAYESGNCTHLNQLDVRNLFVVSVSQICEEQLLYDPGRFQTNAKMQDLQMHILAY